MFRISPHPRPLAPKINRTYDVPRPRSWAYLLHFSHKDQALGTQALGLHCRGKQAFHSGKTRYHLHASVSEQHVPVRTKPGPHEDAARRECSFCPLVDLTPPKPGRPEQLGSTISWFLLPPPGMIWNYTYTRPCQCRLWEAQQWEKVFYNLTSMHC